MVAVETFLRAVDAFSFAQATRAISSVLVNQNRDSMVKVLIAQTLPNIKQPTAKHVRIKELANFAWRVAMFNVQVVDCILIGEEGIFSYREDPEAWGEYLKEMALRQEISGGEFLEDLGGE